MRCSRHGKCNLDVWYDCNKCSSEIHHQEQQIVKAIQKIAARINRPTSKIISNIQDMIDYIENPQDRPSFGLTNNPNLPW
jgi:hypothetical protein